MMGPKTTAALVRQRGLQSPKKLHSQGANAIPAHTTAHSLTKCGRARHTHVQKPFHQWFMLGGQKLSPTSMVPPAGPSGTNPQHATHVQDQSKPIGPRAAPRNP